nr:unnamed protein product [Callosobruchus analis]
MQMLKVPSNDGSSSRVYIKHFSESFTIRENLITREDESVLRIPRDQLKLFDDAYPSILGASLHI